MAATPHSAPKVLGDIRARRGPGSLRTLIVVFTVIVSFVVIDAFVGDRGLSALVHARQQQARLAADVARMKAENDGLREQIRRLRGGDPTAIEEIARRELGLIRPGERLFIIHDVQLPAAK